MRRNTRLIIFMVGVLVLILPFLVIVLQQKQSIHQQAAGGFPHVVSGHLVDGNGNPLILRGAMIDGEFNYINAWQQNRVPDLFNTAAFNAMLSWHMNAIRMPISQWMMQQYASYAQKMDTAITQSTGAGLYTIIDFHDDIKSGAVSPDDDTMMHKTTLQWWVSMASQYKNNPKVMFDLINEPQYPDWCSWAYGGNPTNQKNHNCTSSVNNPDIVGFNDVIAAIRQAGAQNIIVIEPGAAGHGTAAGGGWASFPINYLTDQNLLASKHEYGSIIQDVVAGNPQQAWNGEWGPMIGKYPLYYGEWAVLPNPLAKATAKCNGLSSNNADKIVATFLQYMDSIQASWTGWEFGVDHMVKDTTAYTPTNFSDGAPWQCPDPTTGLPPAAAAHDGMGTDIKNYLANAPTIPVSNTPQVTVSPTITPTPNAQSTDFSLSICPHGLGNCGDNTNPNGGGNTNPLHQQRTITLTLLDQQNQPVTSVTGSVTYNQSSEHFEGILTIPNITSGQYLISVKMDGFLGKLSPGIISVTSGQNITLPLIYLTNGDINNDNQLDIVDYNLLISCYGSKLTTPSCPSQYQPSSTSPGVDILDDDAKVTGADYNQFLRELAVQQGQ